MSRSSTATRTFFIGGVLLLVLGALHAGTARASGATAASAETAVQPGDVQRGSTVYATYCTACHQADGRGLNGMLAADFVGDTSRLAKPDAELLEVIRNGKVGTVGAMPPWDQSLTEQQMVDALAYVRATFQAEQVESGSRIGTGGIRATGSPRSR
ncbi:MAG: cytochrome c [Deltaproteobacteria bacterium]|nr:cytochrome c [Deltaproteobacteria bacterium]